MASTALLSLAALCLSGISLAENVDWANAGTFWGQPLDGNGPYGFGGCSTAQLTVLHQLFPQAGLALEQQIYPEVSKGSQSAAFNTFFSTNGSAIPKWSQNDLSVPQEVFSDIDNGPWNRTVDGLGIANGGPVIFACTNAPSPALSSENPSSKEASIKCGDGLAAANFRTNELDDSKAHWLLCDNFFNDTLYPNMPTQDMCPIWDNSYGYLSDSVTQVKDTRLGLILQMLAQIYSQNAAANRADLQDINSAITQDFSTEIANPTNYEWFGTMVAAGCTSWPDWANPNYNATAAVEDIEAGSGQRRVKRRSVSSSTRDRADAQQQRPKILQTRAVDHSHQAPPLAKHDPKMSIAGRLGTIDNVPAALATDLKKLATIKPSTGKMGMSGLKPSVTLSGAAAPKPGR